MNRKLSWEEKFAAIDALDASACLKMRAPGDWYLLDRIEIGGDGMLRSVCITGAATPRAAVEAWWSECVEHLPQNRHLRYRDRNYRWGGFGWKESE